MWDSEKIFPACPVIRSLVTESQIEIQEWDDWKKICGRKKFFSNLTHATKFEPPRFSRAEEEEIRNLGG